MKLTDNMKNYIKHASVLFASSLIQLIVMVVIHFSNASASDAFFSDGGFYKLFFSWMFIFLLQSVLFSVTLRIPVAITLSTLLCTLFAFAVNITYVITGDPLQPSDFLLAGELDSILSFVDISLSAGEIIMIAVAVLMIAAAFYFFRFKKLSVTVVVRIVMTIVTVILLTLYIWLFGYNTSFINDTLPSMGIPAPSTEAGRDYLRNGALLSFIPKLTYLSSPDMEGYDKKAIEDIRTSFDEPVSFYHHDDTKPTIIAIQNEAWWDPTLLPNVSFSKDPLEIYRSEREDLITGQMVTPVFGGGTCIPEFEYITGFSSVFLPPNCYPYMQAVNGKTPSMVSALKADGYETVAIHTYKTNFYGRKKAYPLLGFDNFIGTDEMEDPKLRGFYVSDYEMAEQIIAAYENKTADNIFIYGLTMQNHGDYTKKRYSWYDVEVTSDALSPEDLQGLADYTQGVYDADKMFGQLMEYFSGVEEPVLIIMYGDHLPLLGTEGSTYTDGGMIEADGEFDYAKHEELLKTPYMIWSNYPLADYNLSEEESAVGLSLFTMKAANLKEVPWYFMVINEFNEKYPVYTPNVIKNPEYEKVPNVSDEDWPTTYAYKLIQYDLLYGRKYGE